MKFPPHTFEPGPPTRWAFTAGGSCAHIPGSKSIACERCLATSGAEIDGPADYVALGAFLHQHAGPVCEVARAAAAPPAKKSRRSA